ncbi:HigA family addiction module antitoxin [Robiginitomaculum antarcticum]|uniref:HigA family addiction module antitoxin n=1 Tax=Robiginitomaculum antarcticum TaxID=437507 RepID=UPI0005240434|nr:HigA family addiction module antitoxin [Robiginitomaculum antarcticum]
MTIEFNIPPEHPAGFLKDWILPEGMTVTEAAKRLGVSRQSLDALLNQRRSLTPEMAKRLELTFGGTARLMLALQTKYDLYLTEQRVAEIAKTLTPFKRAG